jgi:hypothetical protein
VFIDKTGASTKMTRLYGRAPRGWRLLAKAPFGHWKTTTFVAATSSPLTSAPTISKPPAMPAHSENALGIQSRTVMVHP